MFRIVYSVWLDFDTVTRSNFEDLGNALFAESDYNATVLFRLYTIYFAERYL